MFRIKSAFLILSIGLFAFISSSPAFSGESAREEVERLNREIKENGWTWTAGITELSGLSHEESQLYRGLMPMPEDMKSRIPVYSPAVPTALPSAWDWRDHAGTTPAKNQGACGSCWAFAAAGQLESHIYIYDGRIEDISEQAVIDCNPYGHACGGGWSISAYSVFMNYGGVAESCIPYLAGGPYTCTQTSCEVLGRIISYSSVSNNINAIKQAVYDDGPVYTGIYAHDNLNSYSGGCYNADYPDSPNHGVLIVGWDDDACGGDGAWIIKNSWGESWGDDGFGYIQYGVCSIGSGTYTIDYIQSNVFVHMDAPNGGESLEAGTGQLIEWSTSRNVPDSISVYLSIDSGENYDELVARGLPGTATSYSWTVNNYPVETCRLKVVAYYGGDVGGYDISDEDFTITGLPRRYASPTGGNRHPYSLPEWAAHDIQDAVDAAAAGDTVMVAGGSYSGAVAATKPLYFWGGWDSAFSVSDPSTYISSISGTGSLIFFSTATGGVCGVEGFTLNGGSGTTLTAPESGIYGGGVFASNSSYTVIRNNIFNGSGYVSASGFSAGGAIACVNTDSALVSGNVMNDCEAQSGGGIYLFHTDAVIENNHISGSLPDPSYSGTKHGGGIYAWHSQLDMSGNYIGGCGGYVNGGAVYARFSPISMSEDSLASNSCSASGAGIYAVYSSIEADGSVITGNTSSSMGAGIYLKSSNIDISNSLLSLNESSILGGGIYADSLSGSIVNNTADGNTGTYGGGHMFLSNCEGLDIRNNLLTGASQYGISFGALGTVTCQYNNSYGNTPADFNGYTPDGTNTGFDPLYVGSGSGDYHLALHSPAIDSGDPAYADPDGSRSDIGMYGGEGAVMGAPEYVKNLSAAALNDTTIQLTWDALPSGGLDFYAIYGDTSSLFTPGAATYLGPVSAGSDVFEHSPVDTCWYYRVSGVTSDGYAGGYSGQAGACASGADTEPPVVLVTYPDGGEVFNADDSVDIEWIATDNSVIDSVSIYFSINGGSDYSLIAGGEPNDSTYTWTVPATASDSCLVRIIAFDASLLTGEDTSDSLFAIENLTGVEDDPSIRLVHHLEQNHPNPFNGTTTIAYTVGSRSRVDLRIFDTAGRLVKTLEERDRDPGRYEVIWNGRDDYGRAVTSGVYFCRIMVDDFSQSRKVIYLR